MLRLLTQTSFCLFYVYDDCKRIGLQGLTARTRAVGVKEEAPMNDLFPTFRMIEI